MSPGATPAFRETTLAIPALDGYPLGAILLEPDTPRWVLQLQGGTGIPRELYLKFARHAAARGIAVVLYDYRGVGASRPPTLRGFEAYMRWWGERDMPGVLEWIKATYPALPRAILGHSAGAQLVGLMPNHADLAAVAAIAAGSGYWKELQRPYRYFSLLVWLGLHPVFSPVLGYFPGRLLRLGEDLPVGVITEWRDWCLHGPYIGNRLGQTMRAPYFDAITAPIRAWAFTDDPIAHEASTRALFRLYTRAPVTIESVSPASVGLPAIGHAGFFRSAAREALWDQPLDWLERQVGRGDRGTGAGDGQRGGRGIA